MRGDFAHVGDMIGRWLAKSDPCYFRLAPQHADPNPSESFRGLIRSEIGDDIASLRYPRALGGQKRMTIFSGNVVSPPGQAIFEANIALGGDQRGTTQELS